MEELSLKDRGNKLFQEGNYEESIDLYSQAIEQEQTAVLHSNRSSAYLKLNKFYDAQCDAEKAIDLNRVWSKGYFRKAEVLAKVGLHEEALTIYQMAQMIHQKEGEGPNYTLTLKMLDCLESLKIKQKHEKNFPWLCAGIGLIIAVIIIVADYSLTKTPAITHVLLQSLFVMVFSGIGGVIGNIWLWYSKQLIKNKLQPTLKQQEEKEKQDSSEFNGGNGETENNSEKLLSHQHPRYTRAQARHRFKKGKS